VWLDEPRAGVVFYLRDGITRGALMWNVRDKVEWARALIREGRPLSAEERRRAVEG